MISILTDMVIIFGLSMVGVYICHLLRLPSILGFLLTGALLGPHGLKVIHNAHEVEILAEVGVVLLLFTIGLEFSLREIKRLKRAALLGGSIQVFATMGLAAAACRWLDFSWNVAIFCGFLAALSSTAIVLKLMQDRAILDSPGGNSTLAILLFQDIIVVPMMLITPLLAGQTHISGGGWVFLAKGGAMMLALLVGARWLIPKALERLVVTRSRELFIIAVVGLCLGVAMLTWWAGLSLALGAFIAGLILAESPYGHQAVGSIMPMRDIFTSLFFVSIGMLFDVHYLLRSPGTIALILAAVILIKTLTGGVAAKAVGLPLKAAALVALGLSQVGEFSFILAKIGIEHKLLTKDIYQLFMIVSVITMALTPSMLSLGQALGKRRKSFDEARPADQATSGHIIVIGYGINGRNVVRAASLAGIPHMVIEMNPTVVRREQKQGENIFFGDASSPDVLAHAGVHSANAMVIAIADPTAIRRITATAKAMNPGLHIIARTRFVQEVDALYALGADEVIPEEYETSLELFARVLRRMMIPESEIRCRVQELKAQGYKQLRLEDAECSLDGGLTDLLADVQMSTFRIAADSAVTGQTLDSAALRRDHNLTVLAIRRQGQVIPAPDAETVILTDDQLVVLGQPADMAKAPSLFGPKGNTD